jgi:hypothetical protein
MSGISYARPGMLGNGAQQFVSKMVCRDASIQQRVLTRWTDTYGYPTEGRGSSG